VRARAGDPAVPPRTQQSIAVSADGVRWSIVNASPDVRDQLARFPALHPRPGTRDIPLDTILLTSADVDHVLGLLALRESLPYRIVSTPFVRNALLDHNALLQLLEPAWGIAKLDQPVMLDRDGHLEARFFPVPGRVPTWLAKRASNEPETTVGVRITDLRSGRRLVYAPCIAKLDAGTLAEFEASSCSFVDGTCFRNDELSALRPGAPDATTMGHVPIAGPGGSLPALAEQRGRVVYIHINDTNPIVDANSSEASLVQRTRIEIAMDGMELEL
jgi:pyrroloquinoline quinone biosynthesis protein B